MSYSLLMCRGLPLLLLLLLQVSEELFAADMFLVGAGCGKPLFRTVMFRLHCVLQVSQELCAAGVSLVEEALEPFTTPNTSPWSSICSCAAGVAGAVLLACLWLVPAVVMTF